MGISLGDHTTDYRSNLRFTDDVFIFSTSLEQLKRMMSDSKKITESVELKIHPGKTNTNILSNQGSNKRREVSIDNMRVEVIPASECAKYLGQTITFEQQETAEIKGRIRAAWTFFTKYKQALTSRSYPCNTDFAYSTWS